MKLSFKTPSSMMNKRIPTLFGLGVLVIGLVVGMLVFTQGTGVFSPRATPETTPKLVKVTNVTDTSFTVSFLTDEATPGFVRYGQAENSISSRAADDRDQLTGTTANYSTHHITVRGLQPNTQYYYLLGTGSGSTFDNNGAPFRITTTNRGTAPTAAKTVYGSVATENGAPAEGAIVYLSAEGAGEMSTLVKSSGSWAVPLSNARTKDGSNYAQIGDTQSLQISVQGERASQTLSMTVTVDTAQPVPALTFGTPPISAQTPDLVQDRSATAQAANQTAQPRQFATDALSPETALPATNSGARSLMDIVTDPPTSGTDSASASESARAMGMNGTASASAVVDLELEEHLIINTGTPVITGKAAPGVTISIEVNSETQINKTLVANADGSFSLDIAQLSQELEPGEHSVTYSYTDPATGQVVTKTQTFTVQEPQSDTQQIAQGASASPSPTPFGSGNPYPIGGPAATQSATASASPSPTATASATPSARVSMPSTASGVPVSGSVGATMTLVFGGLFFLIAGAWSFWISSELGKRHT